MSDQINERVRKIADTIKNEAEIDEDSGFVTTPKDTYEKTLPDDLDMKTVKKVYGHTENYVAGLVLANAEIGEDLHKKKDHQYVETNSEIPRHVKFTSGWTASKEQRKTPTDPTMVTRHGVTFSRVHTKAQDPNRGELKKVREHARERARKMLGAK